MASMRQFLVGLQAAVLEELHGERSRISIGYDLVILAVDNEHWHIDALEIFREVRLGESLDALVACFDAAHHGLPPPISDKSLDRSDAGAIEIVEGTRGDIEIKLSTIVRERGPVAIERLNRRSSRV